MTYICIWTSNIVKFFCMEPMTIQGCGIATRWAWNVCIVLSLQPQIEWLKYQSLSFPICKYRIRTTDHCITCLTPRGIPGPFVPKRFGTHLRDWGGEKRGGEEVFNQVLSFQCQKISHKQTHPSKGSYCRLAHCKKEGGHEASLIHNCGISCRYPQPTHFSPSAAAAAELKACG